MEVFRYQPDSDVFVLDRGSQPVEGDTFFYSVSQNAWRRFRGRKVWSRLISVDGSDASDAVYIYNAARLEGLSTPERPTRNQPAVPLSPIAERLAGHHIDPSPFNLVFVRAQTATRPLFVTGKPGTGKSTLLKELFDRLPGNTVVLAPTGVAALNVRGQTIHSFFKLGTGPIDPAGSDLGGDLRLIEKLDTIIIDEISMVRADLLDAVANGLRRLRGSAAPFGGLRVLLFGDASQLPPVDKDFVSGNEGARYRSSFFFDANVFEHSGYDVVLLREVYRQTEPEFLAILDACRSGDLHEEHLRKLRGRVKPLDAQDGEANVVILTSTRSRAEDINCLNLEALTGSSAQYTAHKSGAFGNIDPAPEILSVKVGAKVMFTRNDPDKRWVNGTLGVVDRCSADAIRVITDDEVLEVDRAVWKREVFRLDPQTQRVERTEVGRFEQFPLQLAWAVTIHKAQGLTLSRVHVDLGSRAFAHGQAYVAISRCKSFDGLSFERPMRRQDIIIDPRVARFTADCERLAEATPRSGGFGP